MNKTQYYRVPDVLDLIYQDIFYGLYFPCNQKNNRILIGKCNLACELLLKTLQSEEEIVKNLDFLDIKQFREVFFKYISIEPLEFRKRYTN